MFRQICALSICGIFAGRSIDASYFEVSTLSAIPGGYSSTSLGVSPAGAVGATYYYDNQNLPYTLPTLWLSQTPTAPPVPTGFRGVATGINQPGEIIGAIRSANSDDPRPAYWQNGQLNFLDTAGLPAGIPNSINQSGVIAGQIYDVNGPSNAAVWNNGHLTVIDGYSAAFAINNSGQVLVANSSGEAVWSSGTISNISPLGDPKTLAGHDMNNLGHVVGGTAITGGTAQSYGFIWSGGQTHPLPLLTGDSYTYALAINDSDVIVGDGHSDADGNHAVIWVNGIITDLNSLIAADSGWKLYEATDIDNDGNVAGYGSYNGQISAFILKPTGSAFPAAVPEPASLTVLASGAALLLARRRTRR